MILLYLQTRAVQASSPEVELGRSMRDWLGRMGVSIGGKTVREIRDQADRISACRLTFLWHGEKQNAFTKDSIVQHGIQFYDKTDNQMQLWVDTVKLSPTFYAALKDHPVPVAEAALQKISNSSLALDIYIWLAYRLHSIQQPTPVSWSALHTQFGAGYKLVRQFKSRFIGPLKEALSVYPEARIDLDEKGIVLRPSPPPIAKHTYQVLLNSA
ncbi:protein of unknown function (plasmid) [Rhodovastum atsumiense]|nr:protein of unknown function [Rhodovastum atsumiense]